MSSGSIVPFETSALPPDPSKLTVSQLKAFCKAQKISGYSKLGKGALIQRLKESAASSDLGISTTSCNLLLQREEARDENTPHGDHLGLLAVDVERGICSTGVASENAIQNPPTCPTKNRINPRRKKQNGMVATVAHTSSFVLENVTLEASSRSTTSVTPAVDGLKLKEPTSRLSERPSACSPPIDPSVLRALVTTSLKPSHSVSASHVIPNATPTAVSRSTISTEVLSDSRFSSSRTFTNAALVNPVTGDKRLLGVPLNSVKKRKVMDSITASGTCTTSAYLAASSFPFNRLIKPYNLSVPLPGFIPADIIARQEQTAFCNSSGTSKALSTINPISRTPSTAQPTGWHFKKLINDRQPAPASSFAHAHTVSSIHNRPVQGTKPSVDKKIPVLRYLEFPITPPTPSLVPILLPPSLSQRKRVQAWAVILSGLSNEERTQCAQVSRMLRYAVYLSASSILSRYYGGRRFEQEVTDCYSQAMINMWPYLRLRKTEAIQRLRVYERSFLHNFFEGNGLSNPIAMRLWSSPDDERQIVIALRLWFALSVGDGNHCVAATPQLWGIIADVQPVIKGEIWSITVVSRSKTVSIMEIFYVLEATCEVVGRPSLMSPKGNSDTFASSFSELSTLPIRADWSSYIEDHMSPSNSGSSSSLLSLLKWANHEEYDRAISRLWLKRIVGEGALGEAKRVVAERYVFACVVANSIGGQWMTATAMAQEFAGLPAPRVGNPSAKQRPKLVNLYLPEHHHIESVYFTASEGQQLHAALAVVQTPHRSYYILRDNGMQVGCEEDGIGLLWQQLLGCDASGV
ncbi:uncharacterized protein FIBRA_00409 [Fibroporia radiculosa]|uniref:Rho termination factor N-terminal domain-containing protein n=1 Tax=Fibroporia radiculosa TaxID=599839 RepID=J4HRK2_9APHY|nr:uncharacterized protein FIBRA_00409 [Fibroporia radiculosa]CCL98412.1 predicted protein [Fibroporia radiculosa]